MKQFLLFAVVLILSQRGFSESPGFNVKNWENNHSEINIYPNPCKTDKITLEFNKRKIAEVEIMNIAGKQILIKKYRYPENKKLILLDNIKNGIYLVKIKSSDKQIVVKKLLVSK